MTDHRIGLDLFTDVLDVLHRHGFARGDDEHAAGPSSSSATWPTSTKAPRTTQSGPPSTRHPPRRAPEPPGPDSRDAVVIPASDLKTVLIALDIAADYQRDRAEMCTDCPDQSCPACHTRLRDAQAYDQMADRMFQAAAAAPAAHHGHTDPADPHRPSSARSRQGGRPVTIPGKTPDEPGTRRQADGPHVPAPRLAEDDWHELQDDPHDLPSPDDYENWRELQDDPYDPYGDLFPDEYLPWLIGRAEYHIVVDQRRDWQPGGPPSLAELLENLARTREPEPDLEAEP